MIGPVETAALASMGMAIIPVFRRPLAAIIATGNELREPGGDASGDAIFDSNSHTLAAMAVQCGAEPKRLGIVGDDKAALAAAIEEALSCDVIITTGGVSVGEHDYVREAFRKAGCRQVFWGLAVRPGRPVFFGDLDGRPVFGLPGNAVSAMVSFTVLAAPALRAMAGNPEPLPAVSRAVLSGGIKKRREFAMLARARVEKGLEGLVATPTGGQGPHQVFGMAGANALCIIPAGIEFAQAGGTVDVIPFGNGF
jgi:molybdopterin molybdotransferase